MDIIIGSHVSYTQKTGFKGSVLESISYGSNAMMLYTGAPQNTRRNKIDENLLKEGKELLDENNINIENVIVHAPYIVNLSSNDDDKYLFAIRFLKEELHRVSSMGFKYIVLHPGSHTGIGEVEGIKKISNALNEVLKDDLDVTILLEFMSGKGTEIGRSFDELKSIIDLVDNKEKIGVCLDTCHLNDAGYEISKFDLILDELDEKIGLNKLKCLHLNDTKNPVGSKKDRHENIGYGYIGFDNLLNVVYNERIKDVPKILETPYVSESDDETAKVYAPYKYEINMIKSKKFNENLYTDIRNKNL